MTVNAEKVRIAIEQAGSVNKAAALLNHAPATVSRWLLINGYEVIATIRPVKRPTQPNPVRE